MKGAGWRSWLTCVLLGVGVAGCKSQGLPPDPLFAHHKPEQTKAEKAAPVTIAFAEPEVPPDPSALVKPAIPSRGNIPGILTGRPGPNSDPDAHK